MPQKTRFRASKLTRAAPRALHEQLTAQLRSEFLRDVPPGMQIPTEAAICAAQGVSRVTVRRAIQTLVDQGLLVRRQGKGTFTAPAKPRFVYAIDRLGPFMDAFAASDERVIAALAGFAWSDDRQLLSYFPGAASVLAYERVYATGGRPHGLLRITLPAEFAERVSRADVSSMGVYEVLRKRAKVVPARASFSISSELPDARMAALLEISRSSPVLSVDRITFDARDRPIERSLHYLLPEVYTLSVSVQARA